MPGYARVGEFMPGETEGRINPIILQTSRKDAPLVFRGKRVSVRKGALVGLVGWAEGRRRSGGGIASDVGAVALCGAVRGGEAMVLGEAWWAVGGGRGGGG